MSARPLPPPGFEEYGQWSDGSPMWRRIKTVAVKPAPAPAQRAMSVLQATIDREAAASRTAMKARQDRGELTVNERLLSAIFGEIK